MRYPPRLPRVPVEITPNPINLSSAASSEGVLNIYGGKSGNKALNIYDGSTLFLSVDPDNSVTSGRHILIKATPEGSSSAAVVEIEADGSNWGNNSAVLKLISDDASCPCLRIFSGSNENFQISRTGDIGMGGSLSLWGGGSITTTTNGDLTLLPNGTGITIIGDAGSTSHSLAANDDLFVSGKLEIDGVAFFDGVVTNAATVNIVDDVGVVYGSSTDSVLYWSTIQATENSLVLGLGNTSKSLIMCHYAYHAKDFDHAGQTNPTLFIHSATDPDTANTQWISVTHNQTDGVIACGLGMLDLTAQAMKYPFKLETHTPSAADDTGIAGAICWDAAYIYICVGTDEWERVAIASW